MTALLSPPPVWDSVMDSAAARWVFDHVLIGALREYAKVPCACLWGICGHCSSGRHEKCVRHAWGPAGSTSGEGWVTNRKAQVVTHEGRHVQVWLADRTCRWICPCTDCPAELLQAPAKPVQLDLFGAAA